jgi:hypothetical protein
MKIMAIATVMWMGGTVAHGQSRSVATNRKVTACLDGMSPGLVRVVPRAQMLAARIFAGVGVTLEWRTGVDRCPAQGILLSLSYNTPESLKPGTLAYALPYEGIHIVVFCDRILRGWNSLQASSVLAHVLVHEITHILQGVRRHSERGIMKAHWNLRDLEDMVRKPLAFTEADVEWIYLPRPYPEPEPAGACPVGPDPRRKGTLR